MYETAVNSRDPARYVRMHLGERRLSYDVGQWSFALNSAEYCPANVKRFQSRQHAQGGWYMV